MRTIWLRRQGRRWLLNVVVLLVIGVLFSALGWEYYDEKELATAPGQPTTAPPGIVSLVIDVQARQIHVYSDDKLYKTYRIAVGKSRTPTPIGEWNVVWKDYHWGDGFGTRWMGLNVPWGIYGIHGTNQPWAIGQYISGGCIRMRNHDVEELFEWVPIGTPVKIVGRKIVVERTLRYQTSGSDVAVLQMKLRELGLLEGRADGIFGKNTEAAVKAYQRNQGVPETGVVDKALVQMLNI